ncbi:MAG: hypothetical protein ACREDP_12610 [Bradyrhizobium sp.]
MGNETVLEGVGQRPGVSRRDMLLSGTAAAGSALAAAASFDLDRVMEKLTPKN